MMPEYLSAERIWALVPVKRLDRAKSRLADILDPSEREALATAMLCDVLATLVRVDTLAGILVVTDDAEAASIASDHGAAVIADPCEHGFNAAVRHGMRWLEAMHRAGVVVVPGDLPFVTVAEVDAVLSAMRSSPVVIVPATRDGGTNMLAVAQPSRMQPAFGPGSFARHVAAALALGITPKTLLLDGAGHDIDVAADLVFAASERLASRTHACLGRLAGVGFPVPAGSFKEALLP